MGTRLRRRSSRDRSEAGAVPLSLCPRLLFVGRGLNASRVNPTVAQRLTAAPHARLNGELGGAKRHYEEMTEGGLDLFAAEGEYVCAECFADAALRSAVREMASFEECSFCDATGSEPIAAPLEDVVRHIHDCILKHYDDAAECLPYDGREGGYQGTTFDTWDLVEEVELEAALVDEADGLLETIRKALGDRTWCERDPGALREHQVLTYSWEYFAEFIKHERRFFFVSERPAYAERDGADQFLGPADMLAEIASRCRQLNLVARLPAGTRLFRAREQDPGSSFTAPLQLGAPPPSGAKQNRMSPAGVVMTYLAEDQSTALAETVPTDGTGTGKTFALGEFETTMDLVLVDLSEQPSVPSLFDVDRSSERDALIFLRKFVADLAKSIARDDRVHVEYVPTQVVTEFLRTAPQLRDLDVRGLRYKSAQGDGVCIVLFGGRELLHLTPDEREQLVPLEQRVPEDRACLRLVGRHLHRVP